MGTVHEIMPFKPIKQHVHCCFWTWPGASLQDTCCLADMLCFFMYMFSSMPIMAPTMNPQYDQIMLCREDVLLMFQVSISHHVVKSQRLSHTQYGDTPPGGSVQRWILLA